MNGDSGHFLPSIGHRPCRSVLLGIAAWLALSGLVARAADYSVLHDKWQAGEYAEVEHGLRPLAEAGSGRAQLLLAHLKERGGHGGPDYEAALRWYRRAAGQGIPEAQYALGLLYELGYGTEVDAAEAEYWYGRAIASGYCPGELDIEAYWYQSEPPPPIE